MAKIGLWLELEVGIGFLVGLGLGSLTGQRTTTTIVLIALEIIVTPLLARTQIPYFIDGQRLVVGIAMDQLRPACDGVSQLRAPGWGSVRRAGSARLPGHADLGDDLGDRRLDHRLVSDRSLADEHPRRLTASVGSVYGSPAHRADVGWPGESGPGHEEVSGVGWRNRGAWSWACGGGRPALVAA